MAFYTKQEARAAAQQKPLMKSFGDVLTEEKRSYSSSKSYDFFLSHSIRDAELVLGIKRILEKSGFSVYVDWDQDKQLDRSDVSKDTADVLRQRMRQSKSMLYVATNNASYSKWMPWELGYFDGLRNGAVAVLPLLEGENDRFVTQEYLALYPLVEKGTYTSGNEDVFVKSQTKWTTLKNLSTGQLAWRNYD
jgi:hypothetical protein